MKLVNSKQKYACLLFLGVVFFLTRQFPFSDYSVFGNIFLVMLYMISFTNKQKLQSKLTCFIIISWCLCLLFYALIIRENTISVAFRFFLIILLLLLVYWIDLPRKQVFKYFFFLIFFQCVILITIELIMNVMFTIDTYLPVRFFFLKMGWGDIYTYDGYFYRVQIKGNSLIPFAFFLTFLKEYTYRKKRLVQIILFICSIIAGNFAYLIGITIFAMGFFLFKDLHKRRLINRFIIFCTVVIASLGIVIGYVQETIERKRDYSLGTREDQTEVLFANMQDSVFSFLFGKGLGNTLNIATKYRDYTGDIYFELQSIYIFNQLGLINFFIFAGISGYLMLKKIPYVDLWFVYCCYIIYAVTNPYIFDTTQIVVILILLSISNERKEKNRSNYSLIQS